MPEREDAASREWNWGSRHVRSRRCWREDACLEEKRCAMTCIRIRLPQPEAHRLLRSGDRRAIEDRPIASPKPTAGGAPWGLARARRRRRKKNRGAASKNGGRLSQGAREHTSAGPCSALAIGHAEPASRGRSSGREFLTILHSRSPLPRTRCHLACPKDHRKKPRLPQLQGPRWSW